MRVYFGNGLAAYTFAVLASGLGLAVTAALAKPLEGVFFLVEYPAVVCAAFYGGIGPGLVTVALSTLGFGTILFGPTLAGPEAYRLFSFFVVASALAWVAARMREARAAEARARARAEAAEAEARRIGAQQERFVAIVAHDLRNPLNAVVMSAKQLQHQVGAPAREGKGLSRIVASAERMHALVRDLLDHALARRDAGIPVRPRLTRLGDASRAALEEIRLAYPDRSVALDVTGDDLAALDPRRMEQVVCNLVTNALEHGSAGAPVEVSVTGEEAEVRLEVTNRGPPIPQHLQSALFEPFQAGESAASVGLGLFIVREIVAAHGGRVAIRSSERGTTFEAAFPRAATPVPAVHAGGATAAQLDPAGRAQGAEPAPSPGSGADEPTPTPGCGRRATMRASCRPSSNQPSR